MNEIDKRDVEVLNEYGATFFHPGEAKTLIHEAIPSNLYHYKAFFGSQEVEIPRHSTFFYLTLSMDGDFFFHAVNGINNPSCSNMSFGVLITGYMLNEKYAEVSEKFNLPYVNGCCTKQIFQPERAGDPTVQLLRIPSFSEEQAHHIHSTVRVVHILKGKGTAIIGMEKKVVMVPLTAGMSMVLEPMCPHHFATDDTALVCLPVHVFSSSGASENNHPMFNGTFMMNHGVG